MKRYILAAIAVLVMMSGCEYHPYYDGQILRVYQAKYGLIEADGAHLNVPVADKKPYELEIYGGKGKNHRIAVSNPELLTYTYHKASVDAFLGEGIEPARLTINPKRTGDTSIRISDEDTGESININLHIVKVLNMMEIHESQNSLAKGTVLAFEFPSASDVVKICRRNQDSGEMELIQEGKCTFHDCDSTVVMELTYIADADGQPDIQGTEVTKRFLAEFEEGYVSGDAFYMMRIMNLDYMTIRTRAAKDYYEEYEYNEKFRFIDITDKPDRDPESPDTRIFYTRSARLEPWIE